MLLIRFSPYKHTLLGSVVAAALVEGPREAMPGKPRFLLFEKMCAYVERRHEARQIEGSQEGL